MTVDDERIEARVTRAWLMLAERSRSLDYSPPGHGAMKAAQVAAALRGLGRREVLTGLLCFSGQWNCLVHVGRFLFSYTINLSIKQEWNLPRGPGQLLDLVHLALLEETGPTVTCAECMGTGREDSPIVERAPVCLTCEGTGRVPRTQRSRADLIGIAEKNWHTTWKGRYHDVHRELRSWKMTAWEHLPEEWRGRVSGPELSPRT